MTHIQPLCGACGYDRTGLPVLEGRASPCPECGSLELAGPWPGWWRVIKLGSGLPIVWTLGGVWAPLALGAAGRAQPGGSVDVLLILWLVLGMGGTVLFLGLSPLLAAAAYTSSWLTRPGQPGHLRVMLVTGSLGVAAVLGLTVVGRRLIDL